MALEIERKFLVVGDIYKSLAVKTRRIMQGYLSSEPARTVRVRLTDEADDTCRAFITIKSANRGATRSEFEYEIPFDDGLAIYHMCERRVKKVRHIVPWGDVIWEVDEFLDALDGLVIAEVELEREEQPLKSLPPFIGREVTNDPRYYNSVLATLEVPPLS